MVAQAQATIEVPEDVPTIQEAIELASDGDTVLVSPGVYPEAIDFLGRAILVTSRHGAAVTTIDADGTRTTVSFLSGEGEDSILRGFTVTGGASGGDGGGIRCASSSSPRIEACVVSGNSASGKGGGIAGSAHIVDCVIEDNEAIDGGGGVAGAATLLRCKVERNVALDAGGGIWLPPGARPRIAECTLRANRAIGWYGVGGAIFGDPLLEDSLVEDNVGIALFGSPEVRRCILRGNQAYDSAAMYLLGGFVEDSLIADNHAQDGSGGGAISIVGPGVVLRRCVVVNNRQNTFGGYATRGVGVQSSFNGVPRARLEQCVVFGNRVLAPAVYGGDVGGVFGSLDLVSTIIGGNDFAEYNSNFDVRASYCDVEGGIPGTGNFDLDPRFVDLAAGDFRLSPGSPCIDAGHPDALDPDCTRADVGAFFFSQSIPRVTVRNGSGINPVILSSLSEPRLGDTWTARLASSSVPGVTFAGLVGFASALDPGLPSPAGEMLVGGLRVFRVARLTSGTVDDFSFAIPDDPALSCATLHVQGFLRTATGLQLTNALAVQAGN